VSQVVILYSIRENECRNIYIYTHKNTSIAMHTQMSQKGYFSLMIVGHQKSSYQMDYVNNKKR
jgi:hypothetical protein